MWDLILRILHHKTSGPNSVTHLRWTLVFDWYVVRCKFMTGHQIYVCSKEIRLHAMLIDNWIRTWPKHIDRFSNLPTNATNSSKLAAPLARKSFPSLWQCRWAFEARDWSFGTVLLGTVGAYCLRRVSTSVGLVLSFFFFFFFFKYHLDIYNEDFTFFDTSKVGNLIVFLCLISFGSIYYARTFHV